MKKRIAIEIVIGVALLAMLMLGCGIQKRELTSGEVTLSGCTNYKVTPVTLINRNLFDVNVVERSQADPRGERTIDIFSLTPGGEKTVMANSNTVFYVRSKEGGDLGFLWANCRSRPKL